jgi:hypothetical protein
VITKVTGTRTLSLDERDNMLVQRLSGNIIFRISRFSYLLPSTILIIRQLKTEDSSASPSVQFQSFFCSEFRGKRTKRLLLNNSNRAPVTYTSCAIVKTVKYFRTLILYYCTTSSIHLFLLYYWTRFKKIILYQELSIAGFNDR